MSILLRTMMARMATRIIYEGVITSGDLHIATKDGEAMFFHDSIDFSSYAGTDAGDTPYRFVFTDNTGKIAEAWGGAVGGGEALGAECIISWNNTPDYPYETLIVNGNGHDIDSAINSSEIGLAYSNTFGNIGELFKIVTNVTLNSGTLPRLQTKRDTGSANQVLHDQLRSDTIYWTWSISIVTGRIDNGLVFINDGTLVDFSLLITTKKLTDIPATGLHLMFTKNSTTRNMTKVDTGFNPNTIIKVQIYG